MSGFLNTPFDKHLHNCLLCRFQEIKKPDLYTDQALKMFLKKIDVYASESLLKTSIFRNSFIYGYFAFSDLECCDSDLNRERILNADYFR